MRQDLDVIAVLSWRTTRLFFSSWKGLVISIVSPLCMLVFLGPTLGVNVESIDAFGKPVEYIAFFLPGVMTMALFYGSMFTAGNSVVADRVTGFSEIINASPNSGKVLVAGHVLGSVLIGGIQALLFLIIGLAFTPSFSLSWTSLVCSAFVMLGAMFFGVVGVYLGSRVSFSNFSLVFTIASIPLVYASTIFVPSTDFPPGLQWAVLLNPVSIMADLLRAALIGVSSWETAIAGDINAAVLVDGMLFLLYFIIAISLALRAHDKFHRQLIRKGARRADGEGGVLSSPVFEMIANAIGKENLKELLPLIQKGDVDRLLEHFPKETVEKLLHMVREALGKHAT